MKDNISIHAPRTGSDCKSRSKPCDTSHFNPRSPHGERLLLGEQVCGRQEISIHAPRTGSDDGGHCANHGHFYFNPRSPHGERRGRASKGARFSLHFNPRSPHGERRRVLLGGGVEENISIHAPRTGSDADLSDAYGDAKISIHAPRTGSDTVIDWKSRSAGISIHAPRTGSDFLAQWRTRTGMISIHAPRTGSDEWLPTYKSEVTAFQSTLPARGAT